MHALRLVSQRTNDPRPSAAQGPDPLRDARDADLLLRSQRGEEEAFRELVERYEKRAFFIAFGLLNREEEAWDVAQEAFLRVYRSLDRFDFSRSFYTWFFRIVQNLAIDRLRKIAVQKAVPLDGLEERLAAKRGDDSPAESEETRQLVRRVIEKLPSSFRAVLVLRDLEGLSCKEIAPVVGASHATVRWRLHRARKLFKEHWERLVKEHPASS
ncbi:MAG: sigma-70 family RNA polymerase sigma factor [Planctomycetes bacterium]|nr:sigma-70 family RNA polymerase sigma factor [Planctomycetota bacterium]